MTRNTFKKNNKGFITIRVGRHGYYFVTKNAAGQVLTESMAFDRPRKCLAAALEIAKKRHYQLVHQNTKTGAMAARLTPRKSNQINAS